MNAELSLEQLTEMRGRLLAEKERRKLSFYQPYEK
jgi:hypothetical protein